MWDILRFLKSPDGEVSGVETPNQNTETEKKQINDQIISALERTEQVIDSAVGNTVPGDEAKDDVESASVSEAVADPPAEPPQNVSSARIQRETPHTVDDRAPIYSEALEEREAGAAAEVRRAVEAHRAEGLSSRKPVEAQETQAPRARRPEASAKIVPSLQPARTAEARAPERAKVVEPTLGDRLLRLPISQIKPNPFQPRKIMGENEIIELSESIKELGVLQPIIVRELDGEYELVAGERRLRAAQRAGLENIPAVLLKTEPLTQQIIALVENIQRKNLSAIEEALCLQDIISKTAWSQTELSRRMGRSQASIANKLRLLRLDQSVQDLVISGKLGERQARSLLSLSTDEQRTLAQRAIDDDLSARALETMVENWNGRAVAKRQIEKKGVVVSDDGPAGDLLGDLAVLINRHRSRGVAAQWKVKQMDKDALVVEISVELTAGVTDAEGIV
jgi:ParB family chromosome partitioning protein